MWLFFDLAILIIIALCVFIGYKQGLMKSLIKIASFVIAIIIALVLYKPVSRIIINKTTIDEKISSAIAQNIKLNNEKDNKEINNTGIIQNILHSKIIEGTETAIQRTADTIAVKITEILTLLLLFLVLKIILIIITVLTDVVSKLPVIKQANKLGGIIYGIIKGLVIVYTILAIIYLTTPLISPSITEIIDRTIITKILYNDNLIIKLLLPKK